MIRKQLTGTETGWWVVSSGGRIWLPNGDLPKGSAQFWSLVGKEALPIGEWQAETIWLIMAKSPTDMCSPRRIANEDGGLFKLVGRGIQLAEFYRSHHYCGYCGNKMTTSLTEWACLCGHCHERYYPQIAPCIIVAIRRADHILLAQHRRHKKKPIFTVLAGFVELGETIEEAVKREVKEESNIVISNIRYVASQPWPFPHSLMIGFLADYVSGEIQANPDELISSDWYHHNKLPQIPPPDTIARRLIEDTLALCRQENDNLYK
ncbi:NAD(+) diphosphatase [Arsenophonus apicola]|uniref:NAD-capped RNA hydrolase NudC n=1 Tax=Arsenophonus apicola TaxID=2879119 RepID=A0ABY8P366_9GAMM|nr:NAD(+) diphosphatase [Arsenophonus apicola]WGO83411.1 NAD(+) diphosphatase [Arsenophonus apicola]